MSRADSIRSASSPSCSAPFAGAQPDSPRPAGVGKGPDPADFELERPHPPGSFLDRAADVMDLPGVDFSQEFQRKMHLLRIDPFDVGGNAGELADQFRGHFSNGFAHVNGYESSDFLLHGIHGKGVRTI